MSKVVKAATALLLCVIMCLSLTACSKKVEAIEAADQVCVSRSYKYPSMYVYSDKEMVDELVEMYNSIRYEETDETVDISDGEDVYSVSFANGSETVGKIIVDSKNNFMFEAGGQEYHITSDFDYDRFSGILQKKLDESEAKE